MRGGTLPVRAAGSRSRLPVRARVCRFALPSAGSRCRLPVHPRVSCFTPASVLSARDASFAPAMRRARARHPSRCGRVARRGSLGLALGREALPRDFRGPGVTITLPTETADAGKRLRKRCARDEAVFGRDGAGTFWRSTCCRADRGLEPRADGKRCALAPAVLQSRAHRDQDVCGRAQADRRRPRAASGSSAFRAAVVQADARGGMARTSLPERAAPEQASARASSASSGARTRARGPPDEGAERTGLEPAASGVTGRRYNQLNYRSTDGAEPPAFRAIPSGPAQGADRAGTYRNPSNFQALSAPARGEPSSTIAEVLIKGFSRPLLSIPIRGDSGRL